VKVLWMNFREIIGKQCTLQHWTVIRFSGVGCSDFWNNWCR